MVYVRIATGEKSGIGAKPPIGLGRRGFPKTSVAGKAALNLYEKAGRRPLFQEPFLKTTGFWERFKRQLFRESCLKTEVFKQQPLTTSKMRSILQDLVPGVIICRDIFIGGY
jgi:hypothetical protein